MTSPRRTNGIAVFRRARNVAALARSQQCRSPDAARMKRYVKGWRASVDGRGADSERSAGHGGSQTARAPAASSPTHATTLAFIHATGRRAPAGHVTPSSRRHWSTPRSQSRRRGGDGGHVARCRKPCDARLSLLITTDVDWDSEVGSVFSGWKCTPAGPSQPMGIGHTGHVPRAPGFFSFRGAPNWLW